MDIHKPKPWHGLREFLKEYAIIVVGVLTALSAEQVAELVHRHETVGEARRALNAEITFDLGAFQLTASQIDCTERRLDEIERWRGSWAEGKPLRITGRMGTPAAENFRTSVWRVASLGAVVQMPFEDRVSYSHLYDAFENNANLRQAGRDLWSDIGQYLGALHLSEDQLLHIGGDIERIREIDKAMKHNWLSISQTGREMGLRPQAPSSPSIVSQAVASLCKPILGG